jgi:AcrR family transcriptional regulator
MIPDRKASRPRGRPKGASDEAQRTQLLRAAESLLPDSPDDLSLRQVAARAGVTPPLAHYYFGNRAGLQRALVNECAGPRVEQLLTAARELASQPVSALTRLMQRLTLLCANDRFVRCCLLLPSGEPLRAGLRAALQELLQAAQTTGQLRADLSASYLAETLLGLCLFPFLDSGDAGQAERAGALTLQHVALLQHGLRPRSLQS